MPQEPRPSVRRLYEPDDVTRLHDAVLAPSFPSDELVSRTALVEDTRSGRSQVLAMIDDGEPVAGIVGQWSRETRVLLILYLAIAPGRRASGLGGRLLTDALDTWQSELGPSLFLAEVEHPTYHPSSPDHGDPAARVRFYARHDAGVLAVPYFQPGDGRGAPRVPALMLVALRTGGAVDLPSRPVRQFLAEHFGASEGSLADDHATRRLFAALDGERVRLVPLSDAVGATTAQLPVGVLSEPESTAPGSTAPGAPTVSR